MKFEGWICPKKKNIFEWNDFGELNFKNYIKHSPHSICKYPIVFGDCDGSCDPIKVEISVKFPKGKI